MPVIFSRYARQELDDATAFYELEVTGLGQRFREEAEAATKRIATYPRGWPVERGDIRKCLLHRFPYKLLYAIETDHIVIVAVAHQHRQPDYWVDRES